MGLEFVERFFKLTLDNVYRFTCSLMFAVAIVALTHRTLPLKQLSSLLDWLAIPSAWLLPVSEWIAARSAVVSAVFTLVLVVGVLFASVNSSRARSGSTTLLAIVILIEVERAGSLLIATLLLIALLALATIGVALIRRHVGVDPDWPNTGWESVLNVLRTLFLAAAYLASPLGWLISADYYSARGSSLNPLYVRKTP